MYKNGINSSKYKGVCRAVVTYLALAMLSGIISCYPLSNSESTRATQIVDDLQTTINIIRGVSVACDESSALYCEKAFSAEVDCLGSAANWTDTFKDVLPEMPEGINATEINDITFNVGDTIDRYINLLYYVADGEESHVCDMFDDLGIACPFREDTSCDNITEDDVQYVLCQTEKSINQLSSACFILTDINPDIPCLTHTDSIDVDPGNTKECTVAILYKTISILYEAELALTRAKAEYVNTGT